MFNFFVTFSSLVLVGLGVAVQQAGQLSLIGVGLGLVLPVVALIFWNLDRRTAFLVKHAEECLIDVETSLLDERVRLFSLEPEKTQAACSQEMFRHRLWTYGKAFRVLFILMALAGVLGAAVSGVRYLTYSDNTLASPSPPNVVGSGPGKAVRACGKPAPPPLDRRHGFPG